MVAVTTQIVNVAEVPVRIEVQEKPSRDSQWRVWINTADHSASLMIVLDDDQLDALRVAIGQAQQAQCDTVVRIAQ